MCDRSFKDIGYALSMLLLLGRHNNIKRRQYITEGGRRYNRGKEVAEDMGSYSFDYDDNDNGGNSSIPNQMNKSSSQLGAPSQHSNRLSNEQ